MSNNPGGSNAFGNYTIQPGWGDVERETQLTKEAPISGSPIAAQALEAPRRAGRQAQRATKPQLPEVPQPVQQPTPQASSAAVWQQISQLPGVSPLVQSYAAQAQAQLGV